jgi:hypothetical protein
LGWVEFPVMIIILQYGYKVLFSFSFFFFDFFNIERIKIYGAFSSVSRFIVMLSVKIWIDCAPNMDNVLIDDCKFLLVNWWCKILLVIIFSDRVIHNKSYHLKFYQYSNYIKYILFLYHNFLYILFLYHNSTHQ